MVSKGIKSALVCAVCIVLLSCDTLLPALGQFTTNVASAFSTTSSQQGSGATTGTGNINGASTRSGAQQSTSGAGLSDVQNIRIRKAKNCRHCKGNGSCPICNGSKRKNDKRCYHCKGSGTCPVCGGEKYKYSYTSQRSLQEALNNGWEKY